MKVLQINSVCGIGSTGRIATDLADILRQQGHSCKIAYGREQAKNIQVENTIKIGTDTDVKIHGLLTRITDRTGFFSKRATKKLIEEIKAYAPDVIHLHNLHGYYLNVDVLFTYLAEADIPVLWTFHDCWPITGHCAHFEYIQCMKWKNGCDACPNLKSYPKSLLIDSSKHNYKLKKDLFSKLEYLKIITPSSWLSNLVRQSFLKDNEICTIYNGIDLSIFKATPSDLRIQLNLVGKFIILGICFSLYDTKGGEYFIELANKLDDSCCIVLLGIGSSPNLPDNIIGLPKTNSLSELAEIYSMADVYANPTVADNFPATNIEALACGTPVITFATGGSPEAIDECTGIVIPQRDVVSLHNAIRHIKENPAEFTAENCRLRAERLFSKNNRYEEYIKLYEEMLGVK